jgi:hypothetical protein
VLLQYDDGASRRLKTDIPRWVNMQLILFLQDCSPFGTCEIHAPHVMSWANPKEAGREKILWNLRKRLGIYKNRV